MNKKKVYVVIAISSKEIHGILTSQVKAFKFRDSLKIKCEIVPIILNEEK